MEQQIQKIEFDNLRLKKAFEEEHTKAKYERQEKLKESSLRISLKYQISSLRLKGGSGTPDGDGAERRAEINRLNKLLEEERISVDSKRKKAEAEKSKVTEAWKIVKAEKGKVDKEKKIANCGPRISAHALPLDGGLVFFFLKK